MMNRQMLLAAIAVCVLHPPGNPQSGAAETSTAASPAPRAIAIEVTMIEAKGAAENEGGFELSGPSNEVAARIRELESKGQIVVIDRIRLATVENLKTMFQSGSTTPVPTGRSFGGRGGPPQVSYQQQSFGTMISATARVDRDSIVVELQVEKSQLERRESKPPSDDEFTPLGTETLTSQATVRIGSGKTILASSRQTTADAESSAQLILVSARLLHVSVDAKAVGLTDETKTRRMRVFPRQRASGRR